MGLVENQSDWYLGKIWKNHRPWPALVRIRFLPPACIRMWFVWFLLEYSFLSISESPFFIHIDLNLGRFCMDACMGACCDKLSYFRSFPVSQAHPYHMFMPLILLSVWKMLFIIGQLVIINEDFSNTHNYSLYYTCATISQRSLWSYHFD